MTISPPFFSSLVASQMAGEPPRWLSTVSLLVIPVDSHVGSCLLCTALAAHVTNSASAPELYDSNSLLVSQPQLWFII